MRVVLTGSGVNPTLNATLGNANDNGGTVITPKLIGIETINVAFTGSDAGAANGAVRELDLQDSPDSGNTINITRISDGLAGVTVTIDNIGVASENLSVAHSGQPGQNVSFAFKNSALSGDDDETTLTVQDVQLGTLSVESRLPTAGIGFETINLVSKDEANSIGTFQAEDLETLNISGNADLTLGDDDVTTNALVVEAIRYNAGLANTQGSLSKVDASAFEGNLDITLVGDFDAPTDGTSGVNTALTVIGGKGDDIFRVMDDTIRATDLVDGGEGDNTMVVLGTMTVNPNGTAATVKNVQNLEVRTGHDVGAGADTVNINADAFDSLANIYVRNEGQILVGTDWNSAAEGMTVNLNNLTSAQANGITLAHGTTGNSDIANNILNISLKDATGAADTATITIVDGVNSDPRFNFQVQTNIDNVLTPAIERIENLTFADNDTESNSIFLINPNQNTGTITFTGGQAGKFMNLDATTVAAALSGYQLVETGAEGSYNSGLLPINVDTVLNALISTADYRALNDGTGAVVRLLTENINAAAYASDLIVRLSDVTRTDGVSSQSITGGTGNDTFIFDAQGVNSAGYTSGDTVAGGAGTDTLVIDGNFANAITVRKSEWDNTSGIDVLRLAGNQSMAATGAVVDADPTIPGHNISYYIELDDAFVHQTDSGNNLLVISNDGDLNTNNETNLVLNLRALAQNANVTFVGANGNAAGAIASNRVMVEDNSANPLNKLDGGDSNIFDLGAGNNNVLHIFNSADVTINDLANTKNFSTITFENDRAIAQTLNLTLNNTVVDQLVDSYHVADLVNRETLFINAIDNIAVPLATAALNVNAAAVGAQFILNITGAAGADVIVAGAGDDIITGGAGADTLTGGAGADTFGTANNFGAQGQGVAASIETLTGAVANGETLTFGNGVDVITDFVTGTDKLDVVTAATAATNLFGGNATVAGAAGTTYSLLGTYTGGVFTVDSTATAATANVATAVIVGDGSTALEASSGWVILTGVAATAAADFI